MKSSLNILFFVVCISIVGCAGKETGILWTDPVLNMEFVLIPKGSFHMGSRHQDYSSEDEIRHKVKISNDFWLGRTEVTQQQWAKIMGPEEIHPDKPSPFRNKHADYPVVCVSYYDIQEFLKRLNDLSEGVKFRIPTEAEWEYACRAGSTTSFSSGNILSDSQANYKADIESPYSIPGKNAGHPKAVASYPPNPWGLYDMHGNVWEWVSDWYAPYSRQKAPDPQGPLEGKEKVIRGGSWYFGADHARSAARGIHAPDLWGFSIGFRIVCEKG